MLSFKSLKIALICTGCLVLGSMSQTAFAGSYSQRDVCCQLKPVVTYQNQRQRVVHYVTRYDHCGRPYRVRQICYRTVRVPVTKWIRACY